jgi:hypothetical protein
MTRRSVLVAGLAALLLAPEHSAGQQSQAKIPRVGILSAADSERAAIWDAFREGLRDLGYVEGRNIVLEFSAKAGGCVLRENGDNSTRSGTPRRRTAACQLPTTSAQILAPSEACA